MKNCSIGFGKYLLLSFFFFFLGMGNFLNVQAQPALGTTSFATASTIVLAASAPCTAGQSGTSAGYQFTLFSAVNCALNNATGAGSDGHINLISTPTTTGIWQEGRIASNTGSEFQLDNFVFSVLTTPFVGKTITVTGYRDGVAVPGATAVSSVIAATGLTNTVTVDVSADADFDNIDEFRLTPSGSDAQGTMNIQSITISGAVLPIDLIAFGCRRTTDKTIVLDWQTASEDNNKGFEVQQSMNAENFTTIAYVEGKGNSTTLNNYQLFISNPNAAHYRLKQIDFDGKFSYSKIIYQEGSNGKIAIFPNPVKDRIELIGDEENIYQVCLSDIIGNPVENYSGTLLQITDGINASMLRLPAGLYVLKFIREEELQVHCFIKAD